MVLATVVTNCIFSDAVSKCLNYSESQETVGAAVMVYVDESKNSKCTITLGFRQKKTCAHVLREL